MSGAAAAKINPELAGLVRPITELRPDPENARKHGKRNLDAVKASLRRFGQQKAIVATPDGMVIAGNGTLAAALALGWGEIAVVRWNGTVAQAKAFGIADNRSAELAEWDDDALARIMRQIAAENEVPIDELGYTEDEYGRVVGLKPGANANELPEPPKQWVSKAGDLWLLGHHRLLCGDATNPEHVTKLLGKDRASLMATDPPYGVDYEGGAGNERKRERMSGDADSALYERFLPVALERALHPDAAIYLWFAGREGAAVYAAIAKAGISVRSLIVWRKLDPHFGAYMAQYKQDHEPCLYCVRGTPKWYGSTTERAVWEVVQPARNKFHPTQKPVELFDRPIRNHTRKGEIVYEPFAGSGSQIVAAEQAGRVCYAMEIEPRYVDVAVIRWERLTGKKATHATTGAEFGG